MAEMTIKLRVNPATGRYEVKVDLESDADAADIVASCVEQLRGGAS